MFLYYNNLNKAVYTAAPVTGGWAGAGQFGRESNELSRGNNELGRGSKGRLHT